MTDDDSSESQILTLIENWVQAVREGDIEGVLANHATYEVDKKRALSATTTCVS